MRTVAVAPFASEPRAHVTVDVPEQAPCDAVRETNVTDAGSGSVRTTLVAAEGPLFVTTIEYVNV